MRRRTIALVAMAGFALVATSPADARSRDRDSWHDRWDNRRDARRAGVVAGVVAGALAGGAARSRADEHYRECVMDWGYDHACERRYYDERRRARRTGRAVGVGAGLVVREIVRD